jgi:hypothetical protein
MNIVCTNAAVSMTKEGWMDGRPYLSGTPSSAKVVNRSVRRVCVVGFERAQQSEERLHSG